MHFPPVAPVSPGPPREADRQRDVRRCGSGSWSGAWPPWCCSPPSPGSSAATTTWWWPRPGSPPWSPAWSGWPSGGSGSELAHVVLLLGVGAPRAHRPRPDGRTARRSSGRSCLGAPARLVGVAYLTRPEALMPAPPSASPPCCSPSATASQSILPAAAAPPSVRRGLRFRVAALHRPVPRVHAQQHRFVVAARSKTKDASIDAWRAVAEDDRLERDQILYSIQPDGVTLGPETRSLTAIAQEHPRNWLTIAWINTTTSSASTSASAGRTGSIWELHPAVPPGAGGRADVEDPTAPAARCCFTAVGLLAAGDLLRLLRPAPLPADDHGRADPVRARGGWSSGPAPAHAGPRAAWSWWTRRRS